MKFACGYNSDGSRENYDSLFSWTRREVGLNDVYEMEFEEYRVKVIHFSDSFVQIWRNHKIEVTHQRPAHELGEAIEWAEDWITSPGS